MRKPGFYWVRFSDEWIIGYFEKKEWLLMINGGMSYDEKDLSEIDEHRIVREEYTNKEMLSYCERRLQELATNSDLGCLE